MTRIGKTFEQELDNNGLENVEGGWTEGPILAAISASSFPCTAGLALSAAGVSLVSVVSYIIIK